MTDELPRRARILVVDDEPQNVRYLKDVLNWAGYENVEGTTDSRQAVPTFLRLRPDLVILDLLMPEMDGFAVLEGLRDHLEEDDYLPILVLTSDVSREARRRALGAGARDFLTKPMSPTEVGIRVRNLLEARFLHLRCRQLEQRLDASDGSRADAALEEVLAGWAAAVDAGAREPGAHARRVATTAAEIARAMRLPHDRVRRLERAALLHDVPPEALSHGSTALLETARAIAAGRSAAWSDEEGSRSDGSPVASLEARIVAVAHRFDRLRRGGSTSRSVGEAIERVEAEAGSRFDPDVVEALVSCHMAETA